MRKAIVLLTLVALLVLMAPVAASAADDHGPPKVLQIIREQVKPGMNAAHEKFEAGYPQAFAKANWPTHYIAASAMTGSNEAWFLVSFDSMAAAEKDADATRKQVALQSSLDELARQDAQFINSSRTMIGVLQEKLGYGKGPANIALMRYFRIVTFHVRPGHDDDFKEAWGMVKAAHEKADLDEHFAMYHIVAGAPAGTYVLFVPMKSMAEADQWDDLHGTAYKAALGEDGQKRLRELMSGSLEKSEAEYFEFSPRMSYVSKEMIAANPSFWTPKPEVASAKAKKGSETKADKKEKP